MFETVEVLGVFVSQGMEVHISFIDFMFLGC